MPLAKRIIPCLDVDNGRVVKGVNFVGIRDAGDPVEVAKRYNAQGADEITFLDITATSDNRDTILHVIEEVAKEVFIPLTVGGGVRELNDVHKLLNAGADKISVNSTAVFNPDFIKEASQHFGSQCIVVAIDAKQTQFVDNFTHGGRKATGIDAVEWAIKMADHGAGEILLTSMDGDGTKAGYDLKLTRAVSDAVSIPLIASGGVGNVDHLVEGVKQGRADAVLAASIFHFGEYTVGQAKQAMRDAGVMSDWLDQIKWNEAGLVPAIAQDVKTGENLMVAWMDRVALQETVDTKKAVYWSRSRQKLWRKGEESGHQQIIHEVRLDCDADVIVLKIEQKGGIACHTGRQSCFYRVYTDGQWQTVAPVLKDPADIYK